MPLRHDTVLQIEVVCYHSVLVSQQRAAARDIKFIKLSC